MTKIASGLFTKDVLWFLTFDLLLQYFISSFSYKSLLSLKWLTHSLNIRRLLCTTLYEGSSNTNSYLPKSSQIAMSLERQIFELNL